MWDDVTVTESDVYIRCDQGKPILTGTILVDVFIYKRLEDGLQDTYQNDAVIYR